MDTNQTPGQPRPGEPDRDPTPRNDEAPTAVVGGRGQTGARTSASNRQGQYSAPPQTGGYLWRNARGLLTWIDHARRWRFGRNHGNQ